MLGGPRASPVPKQLCAQPKLVQQTCCTHAPDTCTPRTKRRASRDHNELSRPSVTGERASHHRPSSFLPLPVRATQRLCARTCAQSRNQHQGRSRANPRPPLTVCNALSQPLFVCPPPLLRASPNPSIPSGLFSLASKPKTTAAPSCTRAHPPPPLPPSQIDFAFNDVCCVPADQNAP